MKERKIYPDLEAFFGFPVDPFSFGFLTALELLSDRDRETIQLRYHKKMTYCEISIVQGREADHCIPVCAERSRSRLFKVLRRLRHPSRMKHFKPKTEGDPD